MNYENKLNLNSIPVRTWRWLGVNHALMNQIVKDGLEHYLDGKELIERKKEQENISLNYKIITDSDNTTYEGKRNVVIKPDSKDIKFHTNNKQIPRIVSIMNEKNRNSMNDFQYSGIHEDVTNQCETLYNTGVFINTVKAEHISEPIFIDYDLEDNNRIDNNVIIDNNLIIAEEDSEITIIMRYNSDINTYHNGLTKIYGKKGAKISLIKIQTLNEESLHMDGVFAQLDEGAILDITVIEFGAGNSITNYRTDLLGQQSSSNLETAYIFDKSRKIDLNYQMNHIGKLTNSNIDVKGALLDKADKIFRGTIDLRKGASGAKGKEEEYAILLSDQVRNRSVPILLCTEDNVAGQHAASTGKIDENKLFYLMSRGLNELEAKKLIIEASLTPIIDKIPVQTLKDEIYDCVRRKIVNE